LKCFANITYRKSHRRRGGCSVGTDDAISSCLNSSSSRLYVLTVSRFTTGNIRIRVTSCAGNEIGPSGIKAIAPFFPTSLRTLALGGKLMLMGAVTYF